MEYNEGYVALIDILGFGSYVKEETNKERVRELFRFFEKFSYLFNTSNNLHIEVSLFSDTLVLTADELCKLVLPILIVEDYLHKNLNLLFRGGITFGKYFHQNANIFGPAVISAHELELKAVTSRIIVDKTIEIENDSGNFVSYFLDVDGYYCINPFAGILSDISKYHSDEFVEKFYQSLNKEKSRIISDVLKYKKEPVVEKYIWRVRAFNSMCLNLINVDSEEIIESKNNLRITKELKEKLQTLLISEKDYL